MLLASACGTEATAPGVRLSTASNSLASETDPDPAAVSILLDSFSIGGTYTVLPRGGYSSSGAYNSDLNYAAAVNRHPTGIELPPGLPVRVLAEGVYTASPTTRFGEFWCGREDPPEQCATSSYSYSVHGLVPGPGVFNPYGAETGLRIQWSRTAPIEEVYYSLYPNAQLFRGVIPAAVAGVPPELLFRRLSCCYLPPPLGEGAFETYEGIWRFGVVPDDGGRAEYGIEPAILLHGPRTDGPKTAPESFRLVHKHGVPLTGIRWWFVQPASNTFDGERPTGSPPTGLASYPAGHRSIYAEIVTCEGLLTCEYQASAAGAVVVQATLPDGSGLAARNSGRADDEAELHVRCVDPAPDSLVPSADTLVLERGRTAACAVSTVPSSAIAGFALTEWSFIADTGTFSVTRAVDPSTSEPLLWRGVIARSGRIAIRGRFVGTSTDAVASFALRVQARDWNDTLPLGYPKADDVGMGTGRHALRARAKADSMLGNVTHSVLVDTTGVPVALKQFSDSALLFIYDGPNAGLSMFRKIPLLTDTIQVRVNVEALALNSAFWNAQPVAPASPACPRSVVTDPSTQSRIRAHEGTTFQAGSHTQRYQDAYRRHVGRTFESFVVRFNEEQVQFGPMADSVVRLLESAAAASDTLNRVTWGPGAGCNFNFKY